MTTVKSRASLRLLPLVALVCVGAFLAGTRFVIAPLRPVHPLTGRVIAGIATNGAWMDRPERQREEAPDLALERLGIVPGMAVADVGAGTGYMTVRLSALVEPGGRVFANDVQPALLRVIAAKAREAHLANVEIIPRSPGRRPVAAGKD